MTFGGEREPVFRVLIGPCVVVDYDRDGRLSLVFMPPVWTGNSWASVALTFCLLTGLENGDLLVWSDGGVVGHFLGTFLRSVRVEDKMLPRLVSFVRSFGRLTSSRFFIYFVIGRRRVGLRSDSVMNFLDNFGLGTFVTDC